MSRDRERQAIGQIACPTCHAPPGALCRDPETGQPLTQPGRPYAHGERRQAWQAARPADALEAADVLMSDQSECAPGHRHTYVLLAPLTPRGRARLPAGPTRVEHQDVRATLARLRSRGLLVMREDR